MPEPTRPALSPKTPPGTHTLHPRAASRPKPGRSAKPADRSEKNRLLPLWVQVTLPVMAVAVLVLGGAVVLLSEPGRSGAVVFPPGSATTEHETPGAELPGLVVTSTTTEPSTTTTTAAPSATTVPPRATTTAQPPSPTPPPAVKAVAPATPPPPTEPSTEGSTATPRPEPRATTVTPGAYCTPTGANSETKTGLPMTCATRRCDGTRYDQPRWRRTTC